MLYGGKWQHLISDLLCKTFLFYLEASSSFAAFGEEFHLRFPEELIVFEDPEHLEDVGFFVVVLHIDIGHQLLEDIAEDEHAVNTPLLQGAEHLFSQGFGGGQVGDAEDPGDGPLAQEGSRFFQDILIRKTQQFR